MQNAGRRSPRLVRTIAILFLFISLPTAVAALDGPHRDPTRFPGGPAIGHGAVAVATPNVAGASRAPEEHLGENVPRPRRHGLRNERPQSTERAFVSVETDHPPPTAVENGLVGTSFNSISNNGGIPFGASVAVASERIVTTAYSLLNVHSRPGGTVASIEFDSLFADVLPPEWDGTISGPQVIASRWIGRWILTAVATDVDSQESYLLLAIAQGGDADGLWWTYRYAVDAANPNDSDSRIDECGLTADSWGIYAACNLYRWNGDFKYAQLWSFSPEHASGTAAGSWVFWDLTWNSGVPAFGLRPAVPYTSTVEEATFFVNSFPDGGDALLLWKLEGNRVDQPSLTRETVTTAAYSAIGQNVDQPGTEVDLDGGDARVTGAVYTDRRLYAVLTDNVDDDGGRSGWRLFQIDVDSQELTWQTLIATATTDPDGGFYYFYPALALDGYGGSEPALAIFGSWTDTETHVTPTTSFASAAVKLLTSPPSTVGSFHGFQKGEAPYVAPDEAAVNRWGHNGADFDWYYGHLVGIVGVAGENDTWRTRVKEQHLPEAVCYPDQFESDDAAEAASELGEGDGQLRNLCPGGDIDWLRFSLEFPAAFDATVEGASSGQPQIELYDADLAQIGYDGDGVVPRISRTCSSALAAGDYFLRISENMDQQVDSYAVRMLQSPKSLVFSETSLHGTAEHRALVSVTLGPSLVVEGSDLRFVAGERLVITNGTRIGGLFSAAVTGEACD